MTAVLEAHGLHAGYGGVEVLRGVDLSVDAGEVVVLLGANGAGKTTTLLALAGAIKSAGDVEMFSHEASGPLHQRARDGLAFLPEERGIVRALTVAQNLSLAGVDVRRCYDLSPELEPLADRPAGQLSGGEQQILALTRAVASDPKLLLADELSLGLAPLVVSRMLGLARFVADQGAAVLLVEQFARQALKAADRGYVMRRGEIVLSGTASELLADIDTVERLYLGGDHGHPMNGDHR
jgi:branched-chain amino acid transport system ATP-binding protein